MRSRLPSRRLGACQKFTWQGRSWYLHAGFDAAGTVREIFLKGSGADGTDLAEMVEQHCLLASIALQNGASVAELLHSLDPQAPPYSEVAENDMGDSDSGTGRARRKVIVAGLMIAAHLEAERGPAVAAFHAHSVAAEAPRPTPAAHIDDEGGGP